MSLKQFLIAVPILVLLSVDTASGQRRRTPATETTPANQAASDVQREPEDQIKLARQFFQADEKCRGLLKSERWQEAEVACRFGARLSDRFADHRELEKMGAYQPVGESLAGQKRYAEAINYYTRALELARPRLDDSNAEVGELYGRIALAYHMSRDLERACEFYRKATRSYQTAYANIKEEDVVEEGLAIKRGY